MLLSVIICTHNPREDYLLRVLGALRAQTLPVKDWDLILVDNASQPPLADRFDLSWHPQARCVREENPGLTHARLKGISEARSEMLVFVDDDNVLNPDYLENAHKIGQTHPWLGTWSGNLMPEYEAAPPAEIYHHLGCLAISLGKVTESTWAKVRYFIPSMPSGAGLCVRRAVVQHYARCVATDPLRQALGRSGKGLGSGEDQDIYYSSVDLGFGGGLFPELELKHLIPVRRLKVDYLAEIKRGQGYASVVLGCIHQPGYAPPIQKSLRIFIEWIHLLTKTHTDRRLVLASLKGQLEAYQDLKRLGRFK
jgi:glycosyltransferase involved in cell wall biosynthesis